MTPISINEIQIEKLIEMCESLFPQFKYNFYNDEDEEGGEIFGNFLEIQVSENKNTQIHWYEFCMTELAEKIFNPDPTQIQRNIKEKMCDFFWSQNIWWSEKFRNDKLEFNDTWANHPVDYLFKEFKKQQMGTK